MQATPNSAMNQSGTCDPYSASEPHSISEVVLAHI